MSDTKQNAPLLEGLLIGEPMSNHHGVSCCPAIRENTDERYIVKILSIPASQVQLDALLLTGAYASPAQALEYFHELAQEVVTEVGTLDKLARHEGFVPFLGTEILQMKNGCGYHVNLLSPYRRSLDRQMQLEPLTHLGAVNLGLDLCAALAISRRLGYLYLDLKPSNVFLVPNQGWSIGDLGFVSLSTLKYGSYPEKYRSAYTAPEIADAMSTLNDTLDIYALGLVLYQIYNNGQLPFEKEASAVPPAPPMYADYEMAEIILKACDPDPAKRWADPIQMGQALVAYMQRNSVNDTPIIPPPVETPSEPEPEAEPEKEFLTEEENEATIGEILDNILGNAAPPPVADEALPEINIEVPAPEDSTSEESLPELVAEDETAPSDEIIEELEYATVSREVEDILAQADELLDHELPEPAVAPEPIDVPFPAPIVLKDTDIFEEAEIEEPAAQEVEEVQEDPAEVEEEPEIPEAEPEVAELTEEDEESAQADEPEAVDEEADAEEIPEVEEAEDEDEPAAEPFLALEDLAAKPARSRQEAASEETEDDEVDESREYVHVHRRTKHSQRLLATLVSLIALLIALCIGGTLFYQFYYLQNVEFLQIDGSVDSLTAVIGSGIRDDLLEVVCTDTYGNTRKAEVIGGRAHFSNLTPNMQYRVQIGITGFHRLTGITSASYTTAAQTEILNFTAVAGPEDGSVILNFTVNGPESDTWTVGYTTGNAPEKTLSFTGHTVTVSDLIIGSEYTFRLIPSNDQFLTGTWQLNYAPQMVIYANELVIRSCGNGVLVAAWNIPDGLENQSWNVRCYNGNGYDQTLTTTDGHAQFSGLDHSYGYTVEVTAVGMTQNATATVTANPITMTDITMEGVGNTALVLTWNFIGNAPADGWIVDYTIDNSTPNTISCDSNRVELPQYPGSQYEIDVRPVGEVTFYGKHLSHNVKAAATFEDYGVTADDMSFYMCRTPEQKKWDRFDVPAEDYVTEFKVGEKASFLVELWQEYERSEDPVSITYIIRSADSQPISSETVEAVWKDIWEKRFCELDLPAMPETAGSYTVEIYFNNAHVTTEKFIVK